MCTILAAVQRSKYILYVFKIKLKILIDSQEEYEISTVIYSV